MKRLFKTKKSTTGMAVVICSVIIFAVSIAKAGYNANSVGKITQVWTYTNAIAFQLSPMPATNCPINDFFYIKPDSFNSKMNDTAVSIILAALLSGKQVNVGYDNAGGSCYDGRPYIHRVDIIQ